MDRSEMITAAVLAIAELDASATDVELVETVITAAEPYLRADERAVMHSTAYDAAFMGSRIGGVITEANVRDGLYTKIDHLKDEFAPQRSEGAPTYEQGRMDTLNQVLGIIRPTPPPSPPEPTQLPSDVP